MTLPKFLSPIYLSSAEGHKFVTAQKALVFFITITILITIALSGVIEIVIKIMIVTKPPLIEQLHKFE